MSRLEISKVAGLVVSTLLLLCPDAIMAQSRSERARIQELFAARGIAKLAYTVAHAESEGWVFEANEITKEHPSPRLLWKFSASEPDYTVDGKKLAFDLGRNGKSTGIYVMDGRISDSYAVTSKSGLPTCSLAP